MGSKKFVEPNAGTENWLGLIAYQPPPLLSVLNIGEEILGSYNSRNMAWTSNSFQGHGHWQSSWKEDSIKASVRIPFAAKSSHQQRSKMFSFLAQLLLAEMSICGIISCKIGACSIVDFFAKFLLRRQINKKKWRRDLGFVNSGYIAWRSNSFQGHGHWQSTWKEDYIKASVRIPFAAKSSQQQRSNMFSFLAQLLLAETFM